jgi:hypothetical protein
LRQSHIFNNIWLASLISALCLEVIVLSEERGCGREPKITMPEPELTKERKFKCPLDQAIYDSREEYEKHCKEEHDVL